MNQSIEALSSVLGACEQGERCVLAAVVDTSGSTPQEPGSLMAIRAGGATAGTLGGGAVEAASVKRAVEELLPSGGGAYWAYDLTHESVWDDALICGGRMGVAAAVFGPGSELAPLYNALAAAETGQAATLPLRVDKEGRTVAYRVSLEAPPRLFIAGAGHVGQALAREAHILGFIVTLYDDRPEFLDAGRFPEGVRRMEGPIASALQATPLDALSYAVIVTRGHQHDLAALRAVAGRGARYVGMIGSRRKRDAIYAALRDEGVSQDALNAVHCPIGVPIHAVTVDEIAVSIAAELTRVRREGAPAKIEGPIELD